MLIESLIKKTVELQGFRVVTVKQAAHGLEAELAADRRYTPCCGVCAKPARYRDTRSIRRFRHVPLWGDQCLPDLYPAPSRLQVLW